MRFTERARRRLVVAAVLGVLVGSLVTFRSVMRDRTHDRVLAQGERLAGSVSEPTFVGGDAVRAGWFCDTALIRTDTFVAHYASVSRGLLREGDGVEVYKLGSDIYLANDYCRTPFQRPESGIAIVALSGCLIGIARSRRFASNEPFDGGSG